MDFCFGGALNTLTAKVVVALRSHFERSLLSTDIGSRKEGNKRMQGQDIDLVDDTHWPWPKEKMLEYVSDQVPKERKESPLWGVDWDVQKIDDTWQLRIVQIALSDLMRRSLPALKTLVWDKHTGGQPRESIHFVYNHAALAHIRINDLTIPAEMSKRLFEITEKLIPTQRKKKSFI